MVSKEFAKYLEPLLFPVKLYELAHSDEAKSVYWSLDGVAVKLNTEILGKECFRPEIFNVADHKHVFRQLSYYGFTRTIREGHVWEFVHPHFTANDIDKVRTIKRKGKKNQNAITASDTKRVLSIIQSRRSSRLQNKAKEHYSSLIENSDFKDESVSETLIAPKVEEKRRCLRGRRKRNFSSFFEEPVSEEVPACDSLAASQAKKKPRTSRGRKKRDSTSSSDDLLLKQENIFDFLVVNQTKEKPRTLRGRKKRDFSTSCEESLLKNEPILDSLIVSQGNEKPRAPRGRKKRCLSSFSDDRVLEQSSISESSIASHARNNPRANSTSRIKKDTEEPGLILKRSSSLQASLNQSSAGKDLNFFKSTVKSEFDFLSQTGNSTFPSVKEEIVTEKKKPRRTYVRKKRKGVSRRKKEEDPSYHATFKSDIEKYDFTAIAYNYGKYPQTRSCNSIDTKRDVQKSELDTVYVNNDISNTAFRPSVPSTYSEILNYQSLSEDVQSLNVSSEFYDSRYSNAKYDQFVKTELKFLKNDNTHLHQNSCNLVDVETLTETQEKLASLKSIDRNDKFLPEYSIQQPENKCVSRSVSIFNEVPNCKNGSEIYATPAERVKTEQKFEKTSNSFVSERSNDLEDVTIFKDCMTPEKYNAQQSLVELIKIEHNYYCMNIAENCEVSFSNLGSHSSQLNQNSSNELKYLGPIKIKEENFGVIESNVSRHFVLGSGYIWKPINRNSASDMSEINLTCSEKNMTSSLENTPHKLSISNVEDCLNSNSNALAHQKEEKHSSFNFTNVIPGDSMGNQPASRKKETRKRKHIDKPVTNNEILNISTNSDTPTAPRSSQVYLWPADHPGFPQVISCDTPTKMVTVTYAVPQNITYNAQVGMSDRACVSHQVNVGNGQHGLSTYPILHQEGSYFNKAEVTGSQILKCNSYKSQDQVPSIAHPFLSCNKTVTDTAMHSTFYQNRSTLSNSSSDTTIMTAVTHPVSNCNKTVMDTAMHSTFYQNRSTLSNSSNNSTKMTAATHPVSNCNKTVTDTAMHSNFYQNRNALSNSSADTNIMTAVTHPVSSCNKTVMDTAMHSTFYQNQSVLANSSSDTTIMAAVTYPSFCQNQSAISLSKELRSTKKKKKSTKPKKHIANLPGKKEHVISSCRANSLPYRRENLCWLNPIQEIQGTTSNIQAPSPFVSAGSRNYLRYGTDYAQIERLETEGTLPHLQESDIEILDLTDESLALDNDDVFERKNDHSKIYVKPEIDEGDYTLPDILRQELVEYLSEQYISGKMAIDDLLCSENPFIKNYAFDAILLDIFRQK